MKYPLTIRCPQMPVLNTSWWSPWADREAQELLCDVVTFGPTGQRLAFKLIFPKCRIRRTTNPEKLRAVMEKYGLTGVSAVWMVDQVSAYHPPSQQLRIGITYPEEPTVRAPLWEGGNIDVLPVDSTGGVIVLPDGRRGQVTSTLPRTTGRPVGFGLQEYLVDPVECPGEVEWE